MEPFKNNISLGLVDLIADQLDRHMPAGRHDFDRADFTGPVLAVLDGLELKQRSALIADHLHRVLPGDLGDRYQILGAMLHPAEDLTDQQSDDQGITGWGMLPLCDLVGRYGLADFDRSLDMLKTMTRHFSSEFDVRHYLIADQGRALAIMGKWLDDPDHHVRRLVSEGTRPRLPWGLRLQSLVTDPTPMLPLLTALRDDESEYVRRSVANHLNDIAKDHPDLVADLARDWLQGADKNRTRLVKHACRTMIKQGHPGVLAAFGLNPPELDLTALDIATPVVTLGPDGALEFTATLTSTGATDQALVIDYLVHFVKANGTRAPKVFKGSKLTLRPGEVATFTRRHPVRPITTRKYYGGLQALSLRINGTDFGWAEFELVV